MTKPKPKPKPEPRRPGLPGDPGTTHAMTIMELRGTTCRWPIAGESHREPFYCGAPTDDAMRSYCPYHRVVSCTTPEQRRQMQENWKKNHTRMRA